jgi:DNA-binding HxlR family transcriptional regulator
MSASRKAGADNRGRQWADFRADVLAERCPSRAVLNDVTSRWGVLVLLALREGRQRFGELRRLIGGISEKMLAQTLQRLETDGFVARIAHAVVARFGKMSVSEIGWRCGFVDSSHFARRFQQKFGKSPSQYRRLF